MAPKNPGPGKDRPKKQKPESPTIPGLSADANNLYEELAKQDDRGVALIGTAFLDDILAAMLRARLVDDPEQVDELLGTDEKLDKPVSNITARARLAYCLGLIGPKTRENIATIAKIRNKFGHKYKISGFDEESVAKLLAKLTNSFLETLEKTKFPRDGRSRFTTAVVMLAEFILADALSCESLALGKDREVAQYKTVDCSSQS